MHLHRRVKIQLIVLSVVALVALTVMSLHFVKLPAMLFGVGRYTVKMELPQSGGLYETGNVTYRGTEVGRVQAVHLTNTGVEAVLSLKSGIHIPSDLKAQVHSQSAVGESYVELLPRNGTSPPLKDGDVIPLTETSTPPDINSLLSAANTALHAIPHDNLKTVIDESYTAVHGLGPELSRIVKGGANLSIDARKNLDPLVALIDNWQPVANSQIRTSNAIAAWASNVATVTSELQTHNEAVGALLNNSGAGLEQTRQLLDRLQPTLPILMSNLKSVSQVALTYQNDIESLLVIFPESIQAEQAGILGNLNTKQAYRGQYLSFNLNVNLPPPCTTGFLPVQQQRSATYEDYPDRPAGDLYCRIPQDSPITAVRGARNIPCETRPGKRAPTVKMCESDEQYVPLNDGWNWKGDPNATYTGQDIPQLPPGSPRQGAPAPPASAPPPVAAAQYNPQTGTYIGPDGHEYTRSDLAQTAPKDKSWQTMMLPPGN
jgi:phospholipid/cholesterol/gamma-HCH transport system substrate-binding protein